MGSDMANVKNSNLKVPPLKIVLSSATSGRSDSSSSTSPSSESESLDSNLTIISDNQHDKSYPSKSDQNQKDDSTQIKQERASRNASKGSTNDRGSSVALNSSNKRSQDNTGPDLNNGDLANGREQASSSNQRITRSSQRAAQQSKPDNFFETNGDETTASDVQDKTTESARKVKRRKGEPQENEQDNNQQVPPPPLVMANICPADYELPSQNSFELYRDIRKRPYKKLMKLSTVQPKAPRGFKEYVLNSGPYLLDGDKIGLGIRGSSALNSSRLSEVKSSHLTNGITPKLKYASIHPKFSSTLTNLNRHDYQIPKLLEAPKNLKLGSPLYELFQDQERSRQKMRMQHLKERERSVIAAEQEILRAYKQAAIAESKQDLNLSACTYLYLQERYHYIDEKNDSIDCVNPKDMITSPINVEGNKSEKDEASQVTSNDSRSQNNSSKSSNLSNEVGESIEKCDRQNPNDQTQDGQEKDVQDIKTFNRKGKITSEYSNSSDLSEVNKIQAGTSITQSANGKTCDIGTDAASRPDGDQPLKKEQLSNSDSSCPDQAGEGDMTGSVETQSNKLQTRDQESVYISPVDQLVLDRTTFLNNLQEVDEKWTKIKSEMLIRHKNEADSLFALQTLDWEWKAKEIGACDVRVALKIEPEFVPRVEVSSLDY